MITVIGGSGYVGQAYCKRLSREGIPFENPSRTRIDYTCTDKLVRYLQERRPSFLINAAGYTGKPNVDADEKEKEKCLFANAVLPGRGNSPIQLRPFY
jgi:dTDP-4-dehydrorhamnose reductase